MEYPSEGARAWSHIVVGIVTLLTVTVLSLAFATGRKASSRLPPGPRGLPVVGSLLSVGRLPHQAFSKMSKKYGPIMFMHMGSVPTLVVSSPHMAKEVLKTNDRIMASRPTHIIPRYLTYNGIDIAFAPHGPDWRHARKLCTLELLTATRLNQSQALRRRQVTVMIQSILGRSQAGTALNMNEVFTNLTSNTMTQLMWNKSHFFSEVDSCLHAEATEFQEIIQEVNSLMGAVNIGDYIPALTLVSMKLQGFEKRMKGAHERMDKFLENVIDEHRKTAPAAAKERNDFVDVLLSPSKETGSERELLPTQTIKAILWDMLVAGTETTAIALEWALTELVLHPSIMKKVHGELDLVIGPDRLANETDIPNLKYFQAMVKEVFRTHQPAPLLAPHKSMEDCEIEGYHIPAGTQIFINVWSIHRDPAVWESPLDFDPDRFLNSALDVRGQDYELLPFGSGRRMCPALNMAVANVHYSLAQILHAFSWTLPGDQTLEEVDTSERFGASCSKRIPLTVLAKPRLRTHIIHPTSA